MDEESLEAAICAYNAQLRQVELALGAGLDPSQQSDLVQLREDLKQLIELTESSLVAVRKSKLLATLDTNASAQDEEYAAFKEAIAELGTDDKPAAESSEIPSKGDESKDKRQSKGGEEEEESDREEEEELSGMKVKAPYYSSWGTLEYHNAMIVGTEYLEDGSAGVRVLYLYPTHKSLKPCPFFLDDKCRFKENCRFSHGQVVSVEELQPFQEPNLSALEVGSACLAKHSDGIWYTAKITGESCVNAFCQDSVWKTNAHAYVSKTGLFCSSFGGWEAHTRGIGSKLLAQMGYEFGKGLGKNSEGRVEPVQAVVLPRGKSLDQCAEVLQKKKQGRLDPGNSKKCRAKGNNTGRASAGSRKPPRNVFDFLNEKLRGKSTGEKAGGAALPERNSKEIYHASKSTKKALSVRLFQTMEKIEQTQKDIRGIQQALARNVGRHSIATAQLEEKLANAHKQLGQLQAQEASLQREQKKADTHKKMTEF
uniref:Zinc finger CCCH-type with G patch domain-containing protein n=1 Tax=Anser cygnoides TaxID=8845 RepID=A0A8B9INI5_ANSCY